MAKVKKKNTTPELKVRKFLWKNGFRYRLHKKGLPGTPDIVFSSKRKIIFVHGCFWHGHKCRKNLIPKTRHTFWENKISRNQARDSQNRKKLEEKGWEVFTIWECQCDNELTQKKLIDFLSN